MNTYSSHAAICTKFYDLTVDAQTAADLITRQSKLAPNENVLFVGSMFQLADRLQGEGRKLTVVDYSSEMVAIGKERLPNATVELGDLRNLPFKDKFDIIFVVGRVFTHMISDQDLVAALRSCRNALGDSGRIFFDNYEDTKIQTTPYFNSSIVVEENGTEICRQSTTTLLSRSPYVVRWDATYSGVYQGSSFNFSDSMEHRAWSRKEISSLLELESLKVVAQGDNFDETSFYTLVEKI